MKPYRKYPALWAAAIALGACASAKTPTPATGAKSEEPTEAKFKRDRQAILAMAGEYEVSFNYMETAALRDGYETKDPYATGGTELVLVIDDSSRRISLQHILVMDDKESDKKRVIKHWRQTWTYEDDTVYEFKGNRTWVPRELSPAERSGRWTQAVFQVDDSPRYESVGRWVHKENFSSWESEETWRPLPRREYSKRDDYDVLVARNRHTLTTNGWVHEQDNHKLVLDADQEPILALEAGLNVYNRIDDHDFSAGRAYWKKTKDFWADVREAWQTRMDGEKPVHVRAKVDGKKLWEKMFDLASNAKEDGYATSEGDERIREILASFVTEERQTSGKTATGY